MLYLKNLFSGEEIEGLLRELGSGLEEWHLLPGRESPAILELQGKGQDLAEKKIELVGATDFRISGDTIASVSDGKAYLDEVDAYGLSGCWYHHFMVRDKSDPSATLISASLSQTGTWYVGLKHATSEASGDAAWHDLAAKFGGRYNKELRSIRIELDHWSDGARLLEGDSLLLQDPLIGVRVSLEAEATYTFCWSDNSVGSPNQEERSIEAIRHWFTDIAI